MFNLSNKYALNQHWFMMYYKCLFDIDWPYCEPAEQTNKKQQQLQTKSMDEVFRINPEIRILRLTFHRKSAS